MSYTQQDRMYTTLGLCFLIFSFFFLCLLMDMYGSDGPRHFFWLFAISYLMHSGEHTVDVYYIDTILLLFFRPHNRRLMDGDRRRRRSQEKNKKYKIKKGSWAAGLDATYTTPRRFVSRRYYISVHRDPWAGSSRKDFRQMKNWASPLISFLGWQVQTPVVVFLVTPKPLFSLFFTTAGLLIASNINDMLFDRITIDCSPI